MFPCSSRVWVRQNTNQDIYQVGDKAVIHCKVDSDKEKVEECIFMWTIPYPDDKHTEDILNAEKYDRRIRLKTFNDTFSTVTLRNLSMNDNDNIKCITDCTVDGHLTRKTGEGITLRISNKKQEWGRFWCYIFCESQCNLHLYIPCKIYLYVLGRLVF